jgi:tetratricopeptide (TPR) repeat protein
MQRLRDTGQVTEALDAQTRWALDLAAETRPLIFGPRQFEGIDVLSREEGNLAEILRRLLSDGDATRGVPLLAATAALWAITGNHPRFFALADLAEQVLLDWTPPPELVQVAADALGLLLVHLGFLRPEGVDELITVMSRLGVEPEQPWTRAIWAIFGPSISPTERVAAALDLAEQSDPATALIAWQWAAVLAENQGEVDAARTYAEKALGAVDDQTTPWQVATLHNELAMLDFNAGMHHEAGNHARIAFPILERLHAAEDARTMRTSLALTALLDGDLDEAERVLAQAGEPARGDVTGDMVQLQVGAELLLARGDVEGGLQAFLAAVEAMRAVRFPGVETTGQEPWTVLALGAALMAYVRYGSGPGDEAQARALAGATYDVVRGLMSGPEAAVDYPVSGTAIAALAAWTLTVRATPAGAECGVRLLALASAFAYTRWFPVMAWEPLAALAEATAPRRLAEVAGEYDARRGHELRDDVLRNLSAVDDLGLTSSG